MLIRPTMNRKEVAGGDVGAQMIDWDKAGLFGIPLALALDVPILVVGGAPDAEPVLLRARHWRRTDLSALWRQLKVRPVGAFDRVYTAEEMLQQFPGIRLPWSLSRPALTWGLTTLVVLSWIAGTIALIAMLVE